MHELYIAECIIDSVKKSLPANIPAERVTALTVHCGQLDAVIPETLLFLFDVIKPEHGLARATLEVVQVPVVCRCHDCQLEFTLELPVFVCPECRNGNVEVTQGRGIRLTRIVADDPQGDENGNPRHS